MHVSIKPPDFFGIFLRFFANLWISDTVAFVTICKIAIHNDLGTNVAR